MEAGEPNWERPPPHLVGAVERDKRTARRDETDLAGHVVVEDAAFWCPVRSTPSVKKKSIVLDFFCYKFNLICKKYI